MFIQQLFITGERLIVAFFMFIEFGEFKQHLILIERLGHLKHLRVSGDSFFAVPACQVAGPESLVDQSKQGGRISCLVNETLIRLDGTGVVVLFGQGVSDHIPCGAGAGGARELLDDPSIQRDGFLQLLRGRVDVNKGTVEVGLGGLMFKGQCFLFLLVLHYVKSPEKDHHRDCDDDSGNERPSMEFGKEPHPFASGQQLRDLCAHLFADVSDFVGHGSVSAFVL